LRHIGQPSAPKDRDASHVTLEDYEALFLQSVCDEYAYYGDAGDLEQTIALGVSEYVNREVRENGSPYVSLYLKTDAARDTVIAALESYNEADALASRIMSEVYDIDD
jgi:hypothetical protein